MKVVDNPSVKIYVNQIENRITFKIKTGHYLELLSLKHLLGITKSKITKNESDENDVPNLEIAQVMLVHCNIVNSDNQQDSRVLCKLASNKLFGHLLEILPKSFMFSKTFNSKFSYIKV